MPYIKQEDRERLRGMEPGFGDSPKNVGELNYTITEACVEYFREHGGRYQQVNDILGALEGAKLEFYRRIAAPYEDAKIKENGDVY